MVHKNAQDVVDTVIEYAPLTAAPFSDGNGLKTRPCGLGSISVYDHSLFDEDTNSAATRRQISRQVVSLRKNSLMSLINGTTVYKRENTNSGRTQFLTGAFFIIYTLLLGFCAFMFRASSRKVATYAVVVVISACFVSAALGGLLRLSSGDLRWASITYLSDHGAMQLAKFEVQSAGARETRVTVSGPDVDLQSISEDRQYYYGYDQYDSGYFAFDWQPNLIRDEVGVRQCSVPMTPWGQRHLYGSCFQPKTKSFACELTYRPFEVTEAEVPETEGATGEFGSSAETRVSTFRNGTIDLKITNRSNIDLEECHLALVVTPQIQKNNKPKFEEVVCHLSLGPMPSGRTLDLKDQTLAEDSNWNPRHRYCDQGRFRLPRTPHGHSARAWIYGRMRNSSALTVDQARSDFSEHEQLHIVLQEIDPQQMNLDGLFGPLLEDPEQETAAKP